MNISNWGIGKIMQLPDWCFGRRFLIAVQATAQPTDSAWDISEIALPERAVIWELVLWRNAGVAVTGSMRLALGDQLPLVAAQMDTLEPIFNGFGAQGAGPRVLPFDYGAFLRINRLRQSIEAAGRRVILEVSSFLPELIQGGAMLVVSAMPTEVPDWLISE